MEMKYSSYTSVVINRTNGIESQKTEVFREENSSWKFNRLDLNIHINVDRATFYSTNGERRNAYRILVGKPDGKRDHWEDQDVDG
jgi:hypothetical protein